MRAVALEKAAIFFNDDNAKRMIYPTPANNIHFFLQHRSYKFTSSILFLYPSHPSTPQDPIYTTTF